LKQESEGITPTATAMTPDQKRIQELEARIKKNWMGKRYIKKGYRSLNAGQHHPIALIEVLSREQKSVKPLCRLFGIPRSSYHYHVKHRELVCPERDKLSK
jgi:putative transposase